VILKFSFAVPSGRVLGRKRNGMFFFRSVGTFGVFATIKDSVRNIGIKKGSQAFKA
jgi:hypothetical protein